MLKGGFLCIKQEMTQLPINDKFEAVTLLKFLEQEIIRLKTIEKDWYNAIVVWANKKEKNWKIMYKYVKEFKVDSLDGYNVGDKITLDVLKDIEIVTLKGITKGKGFQWVVKRFGFAGGPASHGSKFHRHPWSIGNRKPRRVNKNHPLPGHMWAQNITLKNVKIIATHKLDDDNIVVVKWSVPWSRNSLIRVYL